MTISGKVQLKHVATKPTIQTTTQANQTDLAQCLVLPKPTYNAERKGSLEVVALRNTFAQQNRKDATSKLPSTRSVRFWRDLL